MIKKHFGKWEMGMLATAMTIAVAFSGCSGENDSEENIVIVEQEAPAAEYNLVAVVRGDVQKTKTVRSVYTQVNSEDLSFAVSGKYVSQVYVKEGDAVKKGDLLAELSGGSREAEIEQLEYQIARNKLLLEQIDLTENYEISRRWLERLYNGSFWETNGIDSLQKNNEYAREDYRDAISMDEQQLEKVKREVRQSKLYAGMDGTVGFVKKRLEGSTSVMDEVVIQVMDNEECFFAVSDMTYADSVKDGQLLKMSIIGTTAAGNYLVEPYNRQGWDEQMLFSIADGADGLIIEAGTSGSITIVLDERENVLSLPSTAVHNAEDKWYVYVTNSNGAREVKWVEVGLQGNDTFEILAGLEEGERVILK